jgi:hypothetical protein
MARGAPGKSRPPSRFAANKKYAFQWVAGRRLLLPQGETTLGQLVELKGHDYADAKARNDPELDL